MAQECLTVRGTSRAGGKPELSEPTLRIRRGRRLTDKSYSRDNRLVPPKSSYRRRSSAPRCRLTLARRRRSCQAFGCSPIKKVRELGSDRSDVNLIIDRRTVWTLRGRKFVKNLNCFNRRQPSTLNCTHGGRVKFALANHARKSGFSEEPFDKLRASPWECTGNTEKKIYFSL